MYQRWKKFFSWISYALLLVSTIYIILFIILEVDGIYEIDLSTNETEEFRAMKMNLPSLKQWTRFSEEHTLSLSETLPIFMMMSHMDMGKMVRSQWNMEAYTEVKDYYTKVKPDAYAILYDSYQAIWADVTYFPIPKSSKNKENKVYFSDSWNAVRNYEDQQFRHEGCDIMASKNERGFYPIVSMTDGVIEQIGWLERGGYRIGIRSPSGGYFYYAHFYRYAKDFQIGDLIHAGELLGFMGDSGYSKVEGTVGNFDVHLHLGIYIKTKHYEEVSVNPYWILKYLEERYLLYSY